MATTQTYRTNNRQNDIDAKTILRDVKGQFWPILALAISVSLLSFIYYVHFWHPTYTVETTYAVTTRGTNNDLFTNLSSAQYTAGQFSQIINSSALQKRVAEDLGAGVPMGSIQASIIDETNLLVLSSTASTPEAAFRTLKSAMVHYREITDFIIGNALMKVLIAPKVPTGYSNSFNPFSLMAKVFLGAFAGLLALAAVLSYMKDTVRKGSEMERKLDARYLGSVCHEQKYQRFRLFRRNQNESILISRPTTSFRYVEAVHKVARKVMNQMEKQGAKVLLVTSCLENEGKSTVAANLALALADSGKKTVLVDLDLRKPSQFRIFDQFDRPYTDLGNALAGKPHGGELITRIPGEELYFIFNTRDYSHSTDLLTTGRLERILAYLKARFDYVILDTPPMDAAADPEAIAALADASLGIVREHTSRVRDINDMLDILSSCKAKPIGCVFNDAYDSLGQNLGGYGYGRGYGYGYGYGHYGRSGYGHYARDGYGRYARDGYGRYDRDGSERSSRRSKSRKSDRQSSSESGQDVEQSASERR